MIAVRTKFIIIWFFIYSQSLLYSAPGNADSYAINIHVNYEMRATINTARAMPIELAAFFNASSSITEWVSSFYIALTNIQNAYRSATIIGRSKYDAFD